MAGQENENINGDEKVGENDIEPTNQDQSDEEICEEYYLLDSKLDELNSALDFLEQKNDDIHERLKELLQSNIDIRQQLQSENMEATTQPNN